MNIWTVGLIIWFIIAVFTSGYGLANNTQTDNKIFLTITGIICIPTILLGLIVWPLRNFEDYLDDLYYSKKNVFLKALLWVLMILVRFIQMALMTPVLGVSFLFNKLGCRNPP